MVETNDRKKPIFGRQEHLLRQQVEGEAKKQRRGTKTDLLTPISFKS